MWPENRAKFTKLSFAVYSAISADLTKQIVKMTLMYSYPISYTVNSSKTPCISNDFRLSFD